MPVLQTRNYETLAHSRPSFRGRSGSGSGSSRRRRSRRRGGHGHLDDVGSRDEADDAELWWPPRTTGRLRPMAVIVAFLATSISSLSDPWNDHRARRSFPSTPADVNGSESNVSSSSSPSSRALCSRLTRSAELNSARNTAFDDVTGGLARPSVRLRLGRVQVEGRQQRAGLLPLADFGLGHPSQCTSSWSCRSSGCGCGCACASILGVGPAALGAAPGRSPSRVLVVDVLLSPGHPPNRAPGRTST